MREQLVDDLRGLNTATGASILYVTSDVIEAMTPADELAVLAAGSVIEHGLPEALYRDPHNVGTMALVGFLQPLRARIARARRWRAVVHDPALCVLGGR